MPTPLVFFVVLAFVWRISTVVISSINKKSLKASGAREVGAANSIFLAVSHLAFYVVATVEGAKATELNHTISIVGVAVYVLSALALISVLYSLGPLWTVKIIINHRHPLVRTGLFRWVRHPNYFVSIIPELVGFALALTRTGPWLWAFRSTASRCSYGSGRKKAPWARQCRATSRVNVPSRVVICSFS